MTGYRLTIPFFSLKKALTLLCAVCACALLVFVLRTSVDSHGVIYKEMSLDRILANVSNVKSTKPPVYNPMWTYEMTSSLSKGSTKPNMPEDLFCRKRPQFLPNYKNPCWEENDKDGKMRVRCMPYFHLLGADKCGSTDLFDRILQHPEMEPSNCGLHKECYYWCWTRYAIWMKNNSIEYYRTFERYLGHFEGTSLNIRLREENGYHSHITGEGTPMDVWDFRGWPRIPQNEGLEEPQITTAHLMKHVYPKPKLIVIFRNPVDRLYSDYYFLGYGFSAAKFHKDAQRAVAMIESCTKIHSERTCLFDMDMYVQLPMRIQVGVYGLYMKDWLSVFPRDQFLILRNEDYGHDIKRHMEIVFDFLNISRLSNDEMDVISNAQRKHVTQSKKNKGPMFPETRELLSKFYSKYNEALADMLQDDRFLWKDSKQ